MKLSLLIDSLIIAFLSFCASWGFTALLMKLTEEIHPYAPYIVTGIYAEILIFIAYWLCKNTEKAPSDTDHSPDAAYKDDNDFWHDDLAERIHKHLTQTPENKLTRTALIGAWGSGKSSVGNYILGKARKNGHIAIHINASNARTTELLWQGISEALYKALAEKNWLVSQERWKFYFKTLLHGCWPLRFFYEKYNRFIDTTTELTHISPQQFKHLKQKLGTDKKVIICIDDLDRCHPDMIADFMLTLRNVFNQPKFAFLVAFDQSIVDHALKQRYGDSATDFTHKIFDRKFQMDSKPSLEEMIKRCEILCAHAATPPIKPVFSYSNFLPLLDFWPPNITPRHLAEISRAAYATILADPTDEQSAQSPFPLPRHFTQAILIEIGYLHYPESKNFLFKAMTQRIELIEFYDKMIGFIIKLKYRIYNTYYIENPDYKNYLDKYPILTITQYYISDKEYIYKQENEIDNLEFIACISKFYDFIDPNREDKDKLPTISQINFFIHYMYWINETHADFQRNHNNNSGFNNTDLNYKKTKAMLENSATTLREEQNRSYIHLLEKLQSIDPAEITRIKNLA